MIALMKSTRGRTRLVGALVLGMGAVAAAETPLDWLTRMEQALSASNYTGVFVHEHGGQTETLQVIHRGGTDSGGERIISMDGSGREFIRRGGELYCFLPDQRLVLVEPSQESGLLFGELRRLDVTTSGQYQLRELAPTRISGRPVRVVDIEPRDAFRYGYRLWVDEKSAMPLKTQLRASNGRVVEQIVFTDLRLPQHITDSQLLAQTDATGYRWSRRAATANMPTTEVTQGGAWQSNDLPPGFRLSLRTTQTMPGSNQPVTHLVFSDGMASVSVFLEQYATTSAPADAMAPAADVTQMGSASAWSTTTQGMRVTAIGEVPPDTVRAIASSMFAPTPRRH
jgi:sigma-E factor negative regulatory protein RseB